MIRRPATSTLFPYTALFRSFDGGLCAEWPAVVGGLTPSLPPRGELDLQRLWASLTRRRSEEHTSELQSRQYLVCRLLLEKKKTRSMTSYCITTDYPMHFLQL